LDGKTSRHLPGIQFFSPSWNGQKHEGDIQKISLL